MLQSFADMFGALKLTAHYLMPYLLLLLIVGLLLAGIMLLIKVLYPLREKMDASRVAPPSKDKTEKHYNKWLHIINKQACLGDSLKCRYRKMLTHELALKHITKEQYDDLMRLL